MNKNLLILFTFYISTVFCYSQVAELGVGFTPYKVYNSTVSMVEFKDDIDTIEKIVRYFYKESFYDVTAATNTQEVEFSTYTTVEVSTSVAMQQLDEEFIIKDTSTTLTLSQLKRLLYGFGKSEIIRILLIKQKLSDSVDLKTLIELRRKDISFKEITDRYNIDYISEIWLPSKRIYEKIFTMEGGYNE